MNLGKPVTLDPHVSGSKDLYGHLTFPDPHTDRREKGHHSTYDASTRPVSN